VGGLPEGYSLETASLLLRQARAVIDVVERDGVRHNRIVQLLPLLNSATPQFPAEGGATVSLGGDEWEADFDEDNPRSTIVSWTFPSLPL
jgi:hypothetical protein